MQPTNSTPAERRWRRDRWDEPGTIYFYRGDSGPYREFSCFFVHAFPMASWARPAEILLWPSGEHPFHAAKDPTDATERRILACATPLDAKRLGGRLPLRGDWDIARTHVMLTVQRAKFAVPGLGELLLSTGDRLIAEDSPRDFVWGCRDANGGYTGRNYLGRALMRVRDELRATDAGSRS